MFWWGLVAGVGVMLAIVGWVWIAFARGMMRRF